MYNVYSMYNLYSVYSVPSVYSVCGVYDVCSECSVYNVYSVYSVCSVYSVSTVSKVYNVSSFGVPTLPKRGFWTRKSVETTRFTMFSRAPTVENHAFYDVFPSFPRPKNCGLVG